jgi:hypothetical protein
MAVSIERLKTTTKDPTSDDTRRVRERLKKSIVEIVVMTGFRRDSWATEERGDYQQPPQ